MLLKLKALIVAAFIGVSIATFVYLCFSAIGGAGFNFASVLVTYTVVGTVLAVIAGCVIAVPLHLVLSRLGWNGVGFYLLGGFVTSGAFWLLWFFPYSGGHWREYSWSSVLYFGGAGLLASVVYWWQLERSEI